MRNEDGRGESVRKERLFLTPIVAATLLALGLSQQWLSGMRQEQLAALTSNPQTPVVSLSEG